VLVLLFPGQGSQSPGMLLPWLDVPGAAADLATWSEAVGLDLLGLGTSADADEIRDTAVAQPLLTAAALLSWRALGLVPDAVCGHSVGELPALAVAGVISSTEAVVLAAERGRAMAAAAAYTLTVPLVSIVLKEAFGLSSSEAGRASAWAIRTLAAAYAEHPEALDAEAETPNTPEEHR